MYRLAIFASGSGTNAENITRIFNEGNRIKVSLVLTNRARAGVIGRMAPLGVRTEVVPNAVWDNEPGKVVDLLRAAEIDIVVLAGFMHYVDPVILNAFPDRVINIHPSLLPAYGGKGMWGHHVHHAVIEAREKRSGVTVHYVSPEVDGGEIVMQQEVEITPDDTAESLEAKIHPVEYDLYPRAIAAVVRRLDSEGYKPVGDRGNDNGYGVGEGGCEPTHKRPAPLPEGLTPPPLTPDEEWAKALRISNPVLPPAPGESAPASRATSPQATSPAPAPAPASAPENAENKPASYFALALAATLLCCLPLGIVAVVYSSRVSSLWYAGDREGARRASERAQAWIIASFCTGVLWATVSIPWSLVG